MDINLDEIYPELYSMALEFFGDRELALQYLKPLMGIVPGHGKINPKPPLYGWIYERDK